uniref:Dedicator of cytokinesis TPR repeats region domain-containing protein n=1 Tax=Daphnia galeata TaxID=27404 RepID=A0A8J2W7R1_9CRUS|nr:unnamed protein product [Daphnia galeata]
MGVCKIKRFKSIIVTVTLILVMSAEFSTELDMHGRHLTFIALDVSILHLSVLVYYIFPIRLYVKFIVLNTSLLVMDRLRLFAILNNSFLKFKYTRNYVKQPPYDSLIRGPNGTFTFTGVNYDLITWMSAKFNFTFGLILVNSSLVEKYGTNEAAHYQLVNEENVDGITSTFYLSADRVANSDPTSFVWTEGIFALLLVAVLEFSEENDLSGRHLNYLVFHNPPFDTITKGPNGTFTFFGSDYYLVNWLSARFNFTFSFVLINQTIAEKYGTHEALFYQLINEKDVDGIACSFFLTMDRVERMDFTFHTFSDGFSLVVPKPEEESRLFAFIGPFQPNVWMLIFICVLVVIGMMTFFTGFYNSRYTNPSPDGVNEDSESNPQHQYGGASKRSIFSFFGSHVIYVINTLTNQGCREAFSRTSFRESSFSSLTKPKMKPSIESFEDLAASSEIGIVLRHDTSVGEQILKATTGVYKVLGDKARRHPDQIVGDPCSITFIFHFSFVPSVLHLSVRNTKRIKSADLKLPKLLPISMGYYSMLFKKGSSYTKTVNKGLMDLWESGFLMLFWVKNLPTIPKANECFADKKNQVSRLAPIQLSDLTSAFLILGIGLGLATLSFLVELIYFKCVEMSVTVMCDVMQILHRKDVGPTHNDVAEVIANGLRTIIQTIISIDREDPCPLVSVMLSIFRQMTPHHYRNYLGHFATRSDLLDFLIEILMVFKDLVAKHVYAPDWAQMILLQNSIVLKALRFFSHTIRDRRIVQADLSTIFN